MSRIGFVHIHTAILTIRATEGISVDLNVGIDFGQIGSTLSNKILHVVNDSKVTYTYLDGVDKFTCRPRPSRE